MSYEQAMKWAKMHRKGTRQPMIMSTGSGFWPAHSWLEHDYWPYVDKCRVKGIEPLKDEEYYKHGDNREEERT
jgi:hypothetical protein